MIRSSTSTVQKWFENVFELHWLDSFIDVLFKLTAKLSEILLAAGVILSTANHFQHGSLFSTVLGSDTLVFKIWTWTQAIGFEASAGVVLLMALEANRENDRVKRNILLTLMSGLALVGTIMLVMSLIEASTGIRESQLPNWYGITMAILRGVVSVAYVTIGRVKRQRFSGIPIVQHHEVPALATKLDELSQTMNHLMLLTEQRIEHIEHRLEEVQSGVHTQVLHTVQSVVHAQAQTIIQEVQLGVQDVVQEFMSQHLLNTSSQIKDVVVRLPDMVQEQVQTVTIEQVNPLLQGVIQAIENGQTQTLQQLSERLQEVSTSVHEMRTTITQVRMVTQKAEHVPVVQSKTLVRTTEPAPMVFSEPKNEPPSVRVRRYILDQLEQGHTPSLGEIMSHCDCSKNTAIKYRRELIPDEIEESEEVLA